MKCPIQFSTPNLVVVAVNQKMGVDFSGEIFTCYSPEPISFLSFGHLLMCLDRFFDRIRFPEPSLSARDFSGGIHQIPKDRPKKCMEVHALMEHQGDLATFVVHVKYRKNATWQGNIVWAEKGTSCNFRSALEMLRLMNQAMTEEPEADLPLGQASELEETSHSFGPDHQL